MEQYGQLAGDCHDGLVLRLLTASGSQVQTPLSKRGISAVWSQDVVGALDQQTSEICVASLGDAELRITFAGLAAFWSEPKVAAHISTSTESLLVSESQNECKSGNVADSMNRHHGLGLDILRLSHPLDLQVILLDL